jgi:mono/diheme cytochrome c family protein
MAATTAGLSMASPDASRASRGAQHLLAQAPQPGEDPKGEQAHVHVRVPKSYANANLPTRVWTDPKMIAKGKELYTAKCARCHGEQGDGAGPDASKLALKPADFTDTKMVAAMAGNYWFWRVSEGGKDVEPFKSQGSKMPSWKDDLSVSDRWAVIAYAHTFSQHAGPHTAREHPEMEAGHAH